MQSLKQMKMPAPQPPAAPTLPQTRDLEPRIRRRVFQETGFAAEDAVRAPRNPQHDDETPPQQQRDDQLRVGRPQAQIGAFRDSSPRKTTCVPSRTSRSESHESHTLCRNWRSLKEHKDASLSNKQNTVSSLFDQTEERDSLSSPGSQRETLHEARQGNQEKERTDDRRGHADPLYRAARQGCQPPSRRARTTSRTKPEKGRARVTSSQSGCPSQPGDDARGRTTVVVRTGGRHGTGQRRMSRDTDAAKMTLKRRRTLKPALTIDAHISSVKGRR